MRKAVDVEGEGGDAAAAAAAAAVTTRPCRCSYGSDSGDTGGGSVADKDSSIPTGEKRTASEACSPARHG